MKKKYIYLILSMTLSLVVLNACASDNTGVLELKPIAEAGEKPDSNLEDIKSNYQTSKHNNLRELTDVTMEVKEDSVKPTGLTVVFENDSNKTIIFGEKYILETRADDTWYEVPVLIENYNLGDIGYELANRQTRELDVNWEFLYGKLEAGEYRIIKDIVDFRDSGSYSKEHVACEFALK